MKLNPIIGLYLLALTAATLVGMVWMNQAYWSVYNYVTVIFSVTGAIVLFKQK